jgi:hypothetical protein
MKNTIALLPSEEIIKAVKDLKKRGYTDIWFSPWAEEWAEDLLDPAYEEALAECGIVDEEAQKYLDGRLDFPELVQDKVDGWLQSIWEEVGE